MQTLLVTSSAERAEQLNKLGLEFDLAAFIRFDPLIQNQDFDKVIFDEGQASDNLKKEVGLLVRECETFVRIYEKDGLFSTVVTSKGRIPNVI